MFNSSLCILVHNFNTVPDEFLKIKETVVYDQSDDEEVIKKLYDSGVKLIRRENTGHNLSSYFRYFCDNYDQLPEKIVLLKGNIVGRHLDYAYLKRCINSNHFVGLYNDERFKSIEGVSQSYFSGFYSETNNNWYVKTKPFKYFSNYNDFIKFVYPEALLTGSTLFVPGGCYIIEREMVTQYPKDFWENLYFLVSYQYFPSEAYLVERALLNIFTSGYEPSNEMCNAELFKNKLVECEAIASDSYKRLFTLKSKFSRFLSRIGYSIVRFSNKFND